MSKTFACKDINPVRSPMCKHIGNRQRRFTSNEVKRSLRYFLSSNFTLTVFSAPLLKIFNVISSPTLRS